jgi:hypothetical protein
MPFYLRDGTIIIAEEVNIIIGEEFTGPLDTPLPLTGYVLVIAAVITGAARSYTPEHREFIARIALRHLAEERYSREGRNEGSDLEQHAQETSEEVDCEDNYDPNTDYPYDDWADHNIDA